MVLRPRGLDSAETRVVELWIGRRHSCEAMADDLWAMAEVMRLTSAVVQQMSRGVSTEEADHIETDQGNGTGYGDYERYR